MKGTKRIIHVSGMDCNNCAEGISRALRKKGLKDAEVNFATGEAVYTLVGTISEEEVKNVINDLGYQVVESSSETKEVFFTTEKKLVVSALFTLPLLLHMVPGFTLLHHPILQLLLSLPVVTIGTFHFGKSAWKSLRNFFPNMDVLIFTGFMAAFVYSLIGTFFLPTNEYSHNYLFYETAASIITLVLLGNFIEHKAVKRAASAVESLYKIKPAFARIVVQIGSKEKFIETEIQNLKKGDVVLVNTGERIPADGQVVSGSALIDQSMFTGESEPVEILEGKKIIGGSIMLSGNLRVQISGVGEDSYLNQLIEMIRRASFSKPSIQRLGDKVSAIFVPLVLLIAFTTFFVARYVFAVDVFHSMMNAMAVLVISCPCAMGLATPTAVMVGLGRAAKQGIIFRGGNSIQALAEVKTFLFDKTGTLTDGNFDLEKLQLYDTRFSEEEVKRIIYALEVHSSHPLAKSLVGALSSFHGKLAIEIKEEKGVGVRGKIDNEYYSLGSARMLPIGVQPDGAQMYLLCNEQLIASLFLRDHIRAGAVELSRHLYNAGVVTAMVSGDTLEKCNEVAARAGIKTVYSHLMPHEKLEKINAAKESGYVAMVGDGINDAPSLAAAAVGISFSSATDVAVQSSDVIVIEGGLEKIKEAHQLAQATLRTIKQNLFWAFCYNAVAIPLAAVGMLSPAWGAAFMAFSDLMVVGNSMLLNKKRLK